MGETPFEGFTSAADFSGGFRSWQEQEPSPTNPTKTNALVMVACSTCRLAAQDLVQVLGWVQVRAQARELEREPALVLAREQGMEWERSPLALRRLVVSCLGREPAVVSRFGIGRIDSFQRRL